LEGGGFGGGEETHDGLMGRLVLEEAVLYIKVLMANNYFIANSSLRSMMSTMDYLRFNAELDT
jgi:hypothetical protein